MKNIIPLKIKALLLASLCILSACEGEDDDLPAGEREKLPLGTISIKGPTDSFQPEYQGIGHYWYQYVFTTHALLIRPFVYALKDATTQKTYFFRLKSDISDTGDKTVFTIETTIDDGPIQTIVAPNKVQGRRLCFTFDPAQFVDCESRPFDVMIAGIHRPIVTANFSPISPTFFTAPINDRATYSIPAYSFGEIDRKNWEKANNIHKPQLLKNAYVNTGDSRIQSALNGTIQITARTHKHSDPTKTEQTEIKISAWKYVAKTGTETDKIQKLCATGNTPSAFSGKTVQELSLSGLQNDKVYAVSLCGDGPNGEKELGWVKEVNLVNGLWPKDANHTPGGGSPFVDYDILLKVDNAGKVGMILGPISSSLAFGLIQKNSAIKLDGIHQLKNFY